MPLRAWQRDCGGLGRVGGGAWGRPHLQRVVLTPCLGGHGSATGRKRGGRGDGVVTVSAWRWRCGRDGEDQEPGVRGGGRQCREEALWRSATGAATGRGAQQRGAGRGCRRREEALWHSANRSGDRARRSIARRREGVPSSRRGALAFCKRGTKEGLQLEETWMINKPRSARMLHQRKITETEHKERTLRWRWRKIEPDARGKVRSLRSCIALSRKSRIGILRSEC